AERALPEGRAGPRRRAPQEPRRADEVRLRPARRRGPRAPPRQGPPGGRHDRPRRRAEAASPRRGDRAKAVRRRRTPPAHRPRFAALTERGTRAAASAACAPTLRTTPP